MALAFDENSTFALQVKNACRRGTLSHAVILSGNGDRLSAGRYLAAAYLCGELQKPCMKCNVCRKVMENIHPDVITVQDTEHVELTVESLRQLKQDVYIRPNESERKVYLFADCAQLNERDQNVLLKIVEEGPAYAAFIFCTESAQSLLPTIRSRCTEMKLHGEDAPSDPMAALELLQTVGQGNAANLTAYLIALENRKLKRTDLQALLQDCWALCAEVLLLRRGKADGEFSRQAADSLRALDDWHLQKLSHIFSHYSKECYYNVGVGHILGALLAELSDTGR